jgi:hypothetical protein
MVASAVRPRTHAEIMPYLERLIFGFGMINPLTAIPQLYQIWGLNAVGGLSLITVGAALVMSVLWTAYGAMTRQTVVWATSVLWVGMNTATAVGVAVYS